MFAAIRAIEYHLPAEKLTSARLADEYPDWSIDKIVAKTGIEERRVAGPGECSSDLAFEAACKLFDSGVGHRDAIDYLLLCTQSPDYFLPTTACLLQHRLGLPITAGALDFNLGCSGYVYGLGLAKGLIETGQARSVLLITAETYTKFIHPANRSVRTIFGDAAAATLVQAVESPEPAIGPFVFGTDGSGALNLIVQSGGMRQREKCNTAAGYDEQGNWRHPDYLYMNGAEIFKFTIEVVPKCVATLMERSGLTPDLVDLYVFHQANRYMLEHLRKRLGISPENFFIAMSDCGNTVSCTVPIALKRAAQQGRLRPGARVALVGFGVGYSWGATLIRWQ